MNTISGFDMLFVMCGGCEIYRRDKHISVVSKKNIWPDSVLHRQFIVYYILLTLIIISIIHFTDII